MTFLTIFSLVYILPLIINMIVLRLEHGYIQAYNKAKGRQFKSQWDECIWIPSVIFAPIVTLILLGCLTYTAIFKGIKALNLPSPSKRIGEIIYKKLNP